MRRASVPIIALTCLLTAQGGVGCASHQPQAAPPAQSVALDEPALMAKLRAEVKPAPASALTLAEEGERRFGNSAAAEERGALAIQALINLQRIGAARSRAYGFLERYPAGPFSANVAAMTGVHVTPRGPASP
jgi:hypothetical protein